MPPNDGLGEISWEEEAGVLNAPLQWALPPNAMQPWALIKKKSNRTQEVSLGTKIRELIRVPTPPKVSWDLLEDYFSEQGKLIGINYGPNKKAVDGKGLVGIEVEIENVLKIDPNVLLGHIWTVEQDGSLRNNGREFKTAAIPTQWAQPALHRMFIGLNPTIDFSPRTSIHVHQDVRSLTLGNLLSLVFTYVVVEDLLFKFAGNNRRTSIYCVPLTSTQLISNFKTLEHVLLAIENLEHSWNKYTALNLCPLRQFGTVEYRHLPGTDNVGKIVSWIDLISSLKIWAYKMPYEEVIGRIFQLNTTSQYHSFLDAVFGGCAPYLDRTTLQSDMEAGVTAVKRCAILNEFHQQIVGKGVERSSALAVQVLIPMAKKILSPVQYTYFKAWYEACFPFDNEDDLWEALLKRPNDYLENAPEEYKSHLKIVLGISPVPKAKENI